MSVKTIDLQTEHTTLDDVLRHVQHGEEIILVNGTVPVARVTAIMRTDSPAPTQSRVLGLHAGTTWMSDDFDAPLDD